MQLKQYLKNPRASRAAVKAELQKRQLEKPRRATTLKRQERAKDAAPARMVAYDFETTRIKPGTPAPLYLTAYSEAPEFSLETSIKDFPHLLAVLETQFLTPELYGVKYVAWYGNHFDGYIIAAALLQTRRYIIRPYLTRSHALRGLKILPIDGGLRGRKGEHWEFLDGAAMLGMQNTKLEKFLANFAPGLPKLTGIVDFEKEEFDATNPAHQRYAMRDSVGLYAAMDHAQSILVETFNEPLRVTIGGVCIRIFASHIPRDVEIPLPRDEVLGIVRSYVMRGGYCHCVKRFHGPIWKYDLNQAYAAAMRDAALPCGFTTHVPGKPPTSARAYVARITATRAQDAAPFYYRTRLNGKMQSVFHSREILDTWITSIECDQLIAEGWAINWIEAYYWESSFNMHEFVSKLEHMRMTCDGGPKGAKGEMIKMVGCHSYGKTVEQTESIEYVIAAECPEGFEAFCGDEIEPIENVWYSFIDEQPPKLYHQPQLGAFITAQVRMVLRRAIALAPGEWLYADTDCVVFSKDVTAELDIHASRYGAWKIEEAGAVYQIIAKKVYASKDGDKQKRSSKGMNVKKLTDNDFDEWYLGNPPEQEQTQRNNFLKVMQGAEMYRSQVRRGTGATKRTKPRVSRVDK